MTKKGFVPWNTGTSKTKITFECEYCGQTKTKYRHGRDNVRFCSNECAHKVMKNPWSGKGRVPWNKGKKTGPLSKEHRLKFMTNFEEFPEQLLKYFIPFRNIKRTTTLKGKTYEEILGVSEAKKLKKQRRKKTISHIKKTKYGDEPFRAMIGKHEKQILDYLESCLEYPILRQFEVIGYFLDGYCPALNLAIEIDEKYHLNKEQLEKDKEREKNIRDTLNCNFLRFDVTKIKTKEDSIVNMEKTILV